MQVLKRRGSSPLNCTEPSLLRMAHSGCASRASPQLRSGLMRATTRMLRFFARPRRTRRRNLGLSEIFRARWNCTLERIEGENTGDADEDQVGIRGVPVVSPLLDVHHGGIMLGHVALAHAANPLLPGFCWPSRGELDAAAVRRAVENSQPSLQPVKSARQTQRPAELRRPQSSNQSSKTCGG